jgi:hypothetical protein
MDVSICVIEQTFTRKLRYRLDTLLSFMCASDGFCMNWLKMLTAYAMSGLVFLVFSAVVFLMLTSRRNEKELFNSIELSFHIIYNNEFAFS